MEKLKQILTAISENEDKAGGAISRSTRLALQHHRKKQFALAIGLAIFIVCCLAVSAYLLVAKGSQQGRAFAGLAGIGGAGALEALRRTWKDYSQTDLLLILIQDASEAQVTTLINKLVKKL